MDAIADQEVISHVQRGPYSQKYTNDGLQEAIEKIKNNEMSYGAASAIYNVPKTTLHSKINNPVNSPRGASTILNKEQEAELAEWVLLNAEYGDPRTKQDIMLAAGEIARLDADPKKHFKNGLPTTGWVDGFLKRFDKIVYRTPEAISKASANNTREDFSTLWRNIYRYFDRTNQLELLEKPEHWWNADETAFEQDVLPKKVLAKRGVKTVHRRERGKPKENTTVTYAFSADGDYVEPLITLKDSNSSIADIAFALGSVGANFGINQTDSGWAQSESFYYYVTMHLQKQWEKKNSPKPRILTIDGYRAHFSLRLFRWARSNDVIIIVLYPGGTPYLQMCDTTMFRPMKAKQAQLYSQWRLKFPTKTMNDVEFVKILKDVNDAVIKKETIINGWRGTGLQPFNFNNLNTDGLVSKSPDRLYDFKGDHIESPTDALLLDTIISEPPTVIRVPLEASSAFYTQRSIETNPMDKDIVALDSEGYFGVRTDIDSVIPIAPYDSMGLTDLQISYPHWTGSTGRALQIPLGSIDQVNEIIVGSLDQVTQIPHSSIDQVNEIPFASLDQVTQIPHSSIDQVNEIPFGLLDQGTQIPLDQNYHVELDSLTASASVQDERMRDNISLSSLTGPNGMFRCQFDTDFNLGAFGLTGVTERENGSKISKLTDRIRRDVKELALNCAANDKEKLINILIINQQLDIIDSPKIVQADSIENSTEPRTIKSILKPPTMPQRVKPKGKRNLKVAYGIVTTDEVIEELEQREATEAQQEIEKEEDTIAKNEREKQIKIVDEQVRELRQKLNVLKSVNAAKNKEAAQNKKEKKHNDDPALQEDAKSKRQKEIKDIDDQLQQYREHLKTLKTGHVAANKAVAVKRKDNLEKKKQKGNLVVPTLPHTFHPTPDLE